MYILLDVNHYEILGFSELHITGVNIFQNVSILLFDFTWWNEVILMSDLYKEKLIWNWDQIKKDLFQTKIFIKSSWTALRRWTHSVTVNQTGSKDFTALPPRQNRRRDDGPVRKRTLWTQRRPPWLRPDWLKFHQSSSTVRTEANRKPDSHNHQTVFFGARDPWSSGESKVRRRLTKDFNRYIMYILKDSKWLVGGEAL